MDDLITSSAGVREPVTVLVADVGPVADGRSVANGGSTPPNPDVPSDQPRSTTAKVLWWTLPPLLVFALVRVVFAIGTDTPVTSFDSDVLARWDSGNYMEIATKGYYWDTCAARGTPEFGEICSNVTWYPGYPYLARGVAKIGFEPSTAAILVSQLATLGFLVLLWNGPLRSRLTARNAGLMVLAGFFPGAVYYFALFPLGLLALFMLAMCYCFERRWWWWGAAAGFLAGATYPIAVVFGPVAALWVLLAERDRRWWPRLRLAAVIGGLVTMGTLAVFAFHHVKVGKWNASIEAQSWWGDTINNPFTNWWDIVVDKDTWIQQVSPDLENILSLQTALVTVMLLTAIGMTLFWKGRAADGSARTVDDWAITVMLVLMWILIMTKQVNTGFYRQEATLIPMILIFRRLPWPITWTYALAASAVFVGLSIKFVTYIVV